jgi:hypothetical protein
MKKLDQFLEIHSRWITLIGEHLEDTDGKILEYWRVEKADSLIVLPIQNQQLLLPPPMYRPGIGRGTWDFPGGRVPAGREHTAVATKILQRELGIEDSTITQLTPLNTEGWPVNSSFSNQCLYGFVAQLNSEIRPNTLGRTYPATPEGIEELLQILTCLQCRTVLLAWWWQNRNTPPNL